MDSVFRRRATQVALGIGATYIVAGVAWILLSDALVLKVSSDVDWLTFAQRYKGIAFVLLSGLLVVALVRAGNLALLKAQQRLHIGEVRVQDLFQHHPKPMWAFDEETLRFIAVNHAAVAHYGYSEAEFLGMVATDMRPPEDVPKMMSLLSETLLPHHDAGIVRHRKKSGELCHVHLSLHRMRIRHRDSVLVIADDVSDEVRTRDALKRQEAQFRQLHDSLQEALWIGKDDVREMLYASPAFLTICGHPARSLMQDRTLWLSLVHPEDRQIVEESLLNLVAFGSAKCEYRICRPDGSVRWVADRKRRIVDASDGSRLVGGIIEDITDVRAAAQTLRDANEQLEERVQARTAALQFANEELDAFARTAAHDLKTPLNAIVGFIGLLRARHAPALGTEGDRMAGHVESSARGMNHLINDLLALSQVATHQLQPVPVDLGDIAREVVAELRQSEPGRQVEVQIQGGLHAQADPGLARSLLMNLIGNAWKYSGKRTRAVIEVGRVESPDGAEFFVRDNGAGFDTRQADKLFKPFQRLHEASEFTGTGVGLATCQRIVRRHGGHIRLSSQPDAGTTVSFSLSGRAKARSADGPPSTRDSGFASLA